MATQEPWSPLGTEYRSSILNPFGKRICSEGVALRCAWAGLHKHAMNNSVLRIRICGTFTYYLSFGFLL